MVFANLSELLSMGGHGPYVWAAYLVTLAGLVALVLVPVLAQRSSLRDIARRARRDETATKIPSQE